jgi:formylmethanofuran dehydrogenase subunit E
VSEEDGLESAISNAGRLHGHVGPFLVIGVRMGRIAEQMFGLDADKNGELRVDVYAPLSTPFSCVIDGIQATTRCTIGNQKLEVISSRREIVARFERKDSSRVLRIRLNTKIAEEIIDRMSRGSSVEELAFEIARLPESRLFTIET